MQTANVQLLKDLLGGLREHRYFLLLAIAYVVLGGLFQHALGRPWPFELTTRWFVRIWIWGSTLWLAAHVLARRLSSRARLTAAQFWGAVLLGATVVPVHITFQALKQSLAQVRGFPWDDTLARIDRVVHGGPAWHWYRFLLTEPSLLKVLDMLYVSWFVGLAVVVIWLSWTHQRRLRQRALLALLILWIGAGTLGAWTLASAGPCYRTAVDADAAALVDQLDASGAAMIARNNQRIVWHASETPSVAALRRRLGDAEPARRLRRAHRDHRVAAQTLDRRGGVRLRAARPCRVRDAGLALRHRRLRRRALCLGRLARGWSPPGGRAGSDPGAERDVTDRLRHPDGCGRPSRQPRNELVGPADVFAESIEHPGSRVARGGPPAGGERASPWSPMTRARTGGLPRDRTREVPASLLIQLLQGHYRAAPQTVEAVSLTTPRETRPLAE